MLRLCHVAVGVIVVAISSPAWPATLSQDDIEAICRVTHAEAAGQPLAGKVAVIEVILNRAWASGTTPAQVVTQPHQFEPVMRAGGDWKNLPALSSTGMEECRTMLVLKTGGDVAPGATHFQNPAIVAERAKAGEVRPSLVDFGGLPKVAEIGGHRFYSGPTTKPKRAGLTSMFAGQDELEDRSETELVASDGG